MKSFNTLSLLLTSLLLSAGAWASGEDAASLALNRACENATDGKHAVARGTRCVVRPQLGFGCTDLSQVGDEGAALYVAIKTGAGWKRVSSISQLLSCSVDEENESKVRKLSFQANQSGTYGVFVDAKGDDAPPFRSKFLSIKRSTPTDTFTLKVK